MDIITYALCKKQISESLAGAGALKGEQGLSAYQIAVRAGYSGTEAQWLASLKGAAFTYDDFTAAQLAALKGEKGDAGKSAYEVAVENGYKGTVKEWLASLKGDAFTYEDFTEEELEALKGKAFTYEDFTAEQLEALKGPKGDSYTITDADYEAIAEKVNVPTKTSELTNDSGYITLTDIPQIENKVEDVKVNGVSVLKDKIAEIDLSTTMDRDFTTDITVGHLEAGTTISATDTIADILYKILYKAQETANKITLYFGGAASKPATSFSLTDLDHLESLISQDPANLIANGLSHVIKTGNVETGEGEYPVLVCTKASGVKLVNVTKWVSSGLDMFPLDFTTLELSDSTVYYLNLDAPTYDEDLGGTTYKFTFEEV